MSGYFIPNMDLEFDKTCPTCGGVMAHDNKYCCLKCYKDRKQEPGQTTLEGGIYG